MHVYLALSRVFWFVPQRKVVSFVNVLCRTLVEKECNQEALS